MTVELPAVAETSPDAGDGAPEGSAELAQPSQTHPEADNPGQGAPPLPPTMLDAAGDQREIVMQRYSDQRTAILDFIDEQRRAVIQPVVDAKRRQVALRAPELAPEQTVETAGDTLVGTQPAESAPEAPNGETDVAKLAAELLDTFGAQIGQNTNRSHAIAQEIGIALREIIRLEIAAQLRSCLGE